MLLAWIAAAVLGVISLDVFVGMAAYEDLSWRTAKGWDVLRAECGRCHDYRHVQGFANAPHEWENTVARMLARIHEDERTITPEKQALLTDLLIGKRSIDGAALFKRRCGKCHRADALDPYRDLPPETLTLLVSQHIRQNNFAVSVWEGELIVTEIERRQQGRSFGGTERERADAHRFAQHCGLCHTIRFLHRDMCRDRRTNEQWEELVRRMAAKAPETAVASDLTTLPRRAEAICSR